MRIDCKIYNSLSTKLTPRHGDFVLILDNALSSKFYCGIYNLRNNCLDNCIFFTAPFFHPKNEKIVKFNGVYFSPQYFLKYSVKNNAKIYIITKKEYSLFFKCKTKKQVNILLDNINVIGTYDNRTNPRT